MEKLWTWGGKNFGYRKGDSLFTNGGVEVGRFRGDKIFGTNGKYLGELKNGKLITRKSGSSSTKGSFGGRQGGSVARSANRAGSAMIAGFEDFPDPDSF